MDESSSRSDIESWPELKSYALSVNEIPTESQRALLSREVNSHRGISGFHLLRKLKARKVNQEFLNEICELKNLEYLELDVVTAEDLTPLAKLNSLKLLKIEAVRKAKDLTPLCSIHSLQSLFIVNAKHLSDLAIFSNAHHLVTLGVEGAMWTAQKVNSLKPLSGLASLEYLYMTSVALKDENLGYLAEIPNLRVLRCARFAPQKQFESLRVSCPDLECRWCDNYSLG